MSSETKKARERRETSGFYDRYLRGHGIDIGCGEDEMLHTASVSWDKSDGDAHYMEAIADEEFQFVYSSHCLEDLADPILALKNWARILRLGGFLIVVVPHRDYYERKKELPSHRNAGHQTFWLPDRAEAPVTRSLVASAAEADQNLALRYLYVALDGYRQEPSGEIDGEFSIEAVWQKRVIV